MIARHETYQDTSDIWAKLAAPLPAGVIAWRQDGKAIARDGKYFGRFVAYIDANTVRERLDAVVPGEWDLTLELLPSLAGLEDAHERGDVHCAFKARLQILGVIREDVGTGRDYKAAATDAFKRVSVRFGIAHELYAYEQNWVQVNGDGKYARPLEDPQATYVRRYGDATALAQEPAGPSVAVSATIGDEARVTAPSTAMPALVEPDDEMRSCPKCGGRVWDNRATKRNPKAPDFKCRDRSCDGVIWPARSANGAASAGFARQRSAQPAAELVLDASPLATGTDDIPF